MDLALELREQIRSYVEGRCDLEVLRDWLAQHVQAIADADDPGLQELDGLVWILVSEYDLGHREEDDLRQQLAEALRGQWTVVRSGDTYNICPLDAPRTGSSSVIMAGPAPLPSLSAAIRPAGASA